MLEISDRITILRGGRKIATENAEDCTPAKLARLMVGRDIVLVTATGIIYEILRNVLD